MSSAKEPYKSWLFNFLNRQTIRLQDRVGIAFRNLRSTTEMGTQLLLYPLYLMVQSGRATRQTLESKVQSSLLLAESKTSLSDADDSELDEISNTEEQRALSQDVFPPNHKPNLIITTAQKVLASLPQISKSNAVKSEPVKAFWRMLDWLQTSPVAKQVNLFGESKLASSTPKLSASKTTIPLPNLLVSLDNKVADLETKSWLSTSKLGSNWGWRSPSAKIQEDLTQLPSENPFQIRAIINAGIEYFFGKNSLGVNSQNQGGFPFNLSNSAKSIPLESQTASTYLSGKSPDFNLPPAEEQESWLSWQDVFSNTITSTVQPTSSETQRISISDSKSSQMLSIAQEQVENFTSIKVSNHVKTELETDPNLLETQATTIGYEKHPLEQTLEILDYIFVWIEAKLWQIWQILRSKYETIFRS